MTSNETTGDPPGATEVRDALVGPQLALQSVYLKDCSYEAPNGPRIEGQWNPQVNLDLNTTINGISADLREVVLTVTVSAKHDAVTVFLVEVKQAGVFMMKNLSEPDLARALGSICPSVLFPYARAAVSNLVTQGGFPQFLLPPVNFDALQARTDANGAVTKN
jgi:preprotein translocase subunit SecB